jgi:hypothetical protein
MNKPPCFPGNIGRPGHQLVSLNRDILTDHKDLGSMVLVNMGGTYPNQLLTAVFRGDTKKLAETIDNTTICITG